MNLQRASVIGRDLMLWHGLLAKGWTFGWDRAKGRFGQCHVTHRRITISEPLTRLNSEEEFIDTVLHEIAHALCPPRTGHSRLWQVTAMSVGANPRRCAGPEVVLPPKALIAYCPSPGCGYQRPASRQSRKKWACQRCCLMFAGGKYDDRFRLQYRRAS